MDSDVNGPLLTYFQSLFQIAHLICCSGIRLILNYVCNVALACCPICCSLKYTNLLFKQLSVSFVCQLLSMPPRRKSRRLAEPTVSDATEVQFVPDPVEIQPQQAVAAFTGEDTTPSDTLVSTIVAAVRTAIQSTSAVQPTNVVEAAVQDVSFLADQVVRFCRILQYSIALQFL